MSQNKGKKNLRHHRKRQTWPIALLLGGLLLMIGAIWAFIKPSQSKAEVEVIGSPSLRVDKEIVDLGNVKLGKVVEAAFQITNVGDQTLRFTKAPYIEVLEGC